MVNDANLLSRLAIILVRPKIPENIGAAARIAWNMGITRLILVRDSLPDREPMAKMATHKAAHLIDNLEIYRNLPEALANFTVVVGTTARRGRQRFVEQTPRKMVETLLPQLPNNQVAIIFGPEDTGLTNDDLKYCQMASAIPTADFSSLNLAQAVAIHCYELRYGIIHASKDTTPAPKLATSFELESMYSYLEESLVAIDYVEKVSHTYWMSNIRNFFSRIMLTSKDANIIRGISKKFLLQQKSPNPGKRDKCLGGRCE
ncbi:MAG: TrmJ/YjtD family RNA methyltransferase [Desulforhopalus sp.]|nr:TrmJ/YjtD family RNA methyltransferase [Desulforhopalus sp.]